MDKLDYEKSTLVFRPGSSSRYGRTVAISEFKIQEIDENNPNVYYLGRRLKKKGTYTLKSDKLTVDGGNMTLECLSLCFGDTKPIKVYIVNAKSKLIEKKEETENRTKITPKYSNLKY